MIQIAIRRLALFIVAIAVFTAATTASAFTKPPFPRIAGIQLNTQPLSYNDPGYQAGIAKEDLAVLSYWPGMSLGGQSLQSIVQAIKAKNPNELVFIYVRSDSMSYPVANDVLATWRNKMYSMKWWLYQDSALTQAVKSLDGSNDYTLNNTLFTPKDSNGDNSVDWMTKYFVSSWYKPNSAVDGLFMDNVFEQPNVSGDWQRNGKVESAKDPNAGTWLRQGYARYFSLVRTLMPGKYQIGNVAQWGQSGAVASEYQGIADGGLMEAYIGKTWSVENWGGWQAMMTRYRNTMAALKDPKLGIVGQWGDPHDYQSMRYGLGSTLLGDAYYSFTDASQGYYGVVWFDEFDVKLGQPSAATPPTAAWQAGVWRRDFDNGIVLVNPKGNGAKTVTLETDFVKVKGTQDPVTNNGQTVRTVTLKDRDGIILLRKNPVKRPASPANLTAQQ
jgi:hypothetical protein